MPLLVFPMQYLENRDVLFATINAQNRIKLDFHEIYLNNNT